MRISRFTKWVVILNCTVPAMLLAWDAVQGDLGANPVNFAIRTTGILSLIFLVLSLTVTPLSRLSGWSWLGQFRRVFGLYAFFHAFIHFGLFFIFDRSGNIADTLSEIGTRRYLLVGIAGLLIMLPLAITSTNRMVQRLGPKRWKMLHRFAYLAAAAGALLCSWNPVRSVLSISRCAISAVDSMPAILSLNSSGLEARRSASSIVMRSRL